MEDVTIEVLVPLIGERPPIPVRIPIHRNLIPPAPAQRGTKFAVIRMDPAVHASRTAQDDALGPYYTISLSTLEGRRESYSHAEMLSRAARLSRDGWEVRYEI